MIRRITTAFAIAAAITLALPLMGQQSPPSSQLTQPRLSPHDTVSARLGAGRGGALVTITYGRPFSKDPKTGEKRKIWGTGNVVPYGAVWRMGSDEATTLITQVDLAFGDTTVPAGAYTLCMQPEADGTAKLIINKQIGQWGIPYTPDIQKNELARVDMKKEPLDKEAEEFTITLTPANGGLALAAKWENTQYTVNFTKK